MPMKYPSRIVCLTEETTETLYLLGQGDRIVGVSGYTVRPPEARQKPKVSAFINAKFDKIEALRAGSRAGVLRSAGRSRRRARPPRPRRSSTFNQRSVAEILQMIRDARRTGRLPARRPKRLADRLDGGPRSHPRVRGAISASAARVLRRVGRPADLGDPLGRGARRDRRRRADLPGAGHARPRARIASSIRRRSRGAIPR